MERKHKHIVELGLTLLHHVSLPLKFWDSAFCTAVYLINRLPTASLNFSVPYYVLFQKSPDYNFLKTFGCSCFPLLRPYDNHKFESSAPSGQSTSSSTQYYFPPIPISQPSNLPQPTQTQFPSVAGFPTQSVSSNAGQLPHGSI